MAERVGFEPTVPVRVRRFSRPFRYDHFGISPFVAKTSYHKILLLSIHFCFLFLIIAKTDCFVFYKDVDIINIIYTLIYTLRKMGKESFGRKEGKRRVYETHGIVEKKGNKK